MGEEDRISFERMVPQLIENFNSWLKLMPNDWTRKEILDGIEYCHDCGAKLNNNGRYCQYDD